jgi:hypothetical protein
MEAKKIITLLIILTFGVGCSDDTKTKNLPLVNNEVDYKLKVIDGCEYILYENGHPLGSNYSMSLTHKGNCKNYGAHQ